MPTPAPDFVPQLLRFFPELCCVGLAGITVLLTEFLLQHERRSIRLMERGLPGPQRPWLSAVSLLLILSPVLVGNQFAWWIGAQSSTNEGYLHLTFAASASIISLSLWKLCHQAADNSLQLRLCPEERAAYAPDQFETRQRWLWAVNGFVSMGAGFLVGWSGGWSWLAALVGGIAYLVVSTAIMGGGQKTTYRTLPAPPQSQEAPVWLQSTAIESDLRHLWSMSGRPATSAFSLMQAIQGPGLPLQDPLRRRKWLQRQLTTFMAAPRPPRPFLVFLPAFHLLPTDSWLAEMSTRILGQNRTRFRLAVLRLPLLRYLVVLWDWSPAWLIGIGVWLLIYSVFLAVVFLLPQTQDYLGLGINLMVFAALAFNMLVNGRGQSRLIHGYRGWREVMPEWDGTPDRLAVPGFLKAMAISDVITAGFRRPEILRLLYHGNPAVRKILHRAGLDESCLTPDMFSEAVATGKACVEQACESNAWIQASSGGPAKA